MERNIRGYAGLILRTHGARAAAYVGDFSHAVGRLRFATVMFLKQLPGVDRLAIARILGISLRTVDAWSSTGRQESAHGVGVVPSNTREQRIYEAAIGLLETTEDYLSLGTIADHVKAEVDVRIPTTEVRKRLEGYAGIKLLEKHPHDPDGYRLAVRPPWRLDQDPDRVAKLIEVVMPMVFDLGYQVYAGGQHAHLRADIFDIPEARIKDFTDAFIAERHAEIGRLTKLEKKLWAETPDGPRKKYRIVALSGPSDLDTGIMDLESTPYSTGADNDNEVEQA